jgi:hypothetical protein
MKKFSSLFLAILMVLSLPIFTFGSTLDTETSNASLTYKSPKFNIKLISDNHIEVSSKDGKRRLYKVSKFITNVHSTRIPYSEVYRNAF